MNNILIIEDDPITAKIYRTRLEKEGYHVEVAGDGQIGFYRLQQSCPDGVLLDLMLPKTSGIELLKKIRQTEGLQHLPVIAYTNAFVPEMIKDALGAGATKVLDKSCVTPATLVDAFRLALAA
jgi:CheY-like chemotaxis protein